MYCFESYFEWIRVGSQILWEKITTPEAGKGEGSAINIEKYGRIGMHA
jgi:hypothetical protein